MPPKLIQDLIAEVATQIASTFNTEPNQAALIFDRIFLRQTSFDLKPEWQFEIVDEDCGSRWGELVREVHQNYINLMDDIEKNEIKEFAILKFKEAFASFSIDFSLYYPNDYIKLKGRLISFSSVVKRLYEASTSEEGWIQTIGGIYKYSNLDANLFFSKADNQSFIKGYPTSYDPTTQQLLHELNQIYPGFSDEMEKSYKDKFIWQIYEHFFGVNSSGQTAIYNKISLIESGNSLVFEYQAQTLMAINTEGHVITVSDVHQSQKALINNMIEECPYVINLPDADKTKIRQLITHFSESKTASLASLAVS